MTRISRSPYPEGLIISGMSVEKEVNSTLKWTNVYKFDSAEEDFTKAQEELARRGEPSPFRDFSLERDGEFVEWSISIEEKYMIALLFYG